MCLALPSEKSFPSACILRYIHIYIRVCSHVINVVPYHCLVKAFIKTDEREIRHATRIWIYELRSCENDISSSNNNSKFSDKQKQRESKNTNNKAGLIKMARSNDTKLALQPDIYMYEILGNKSITKRFVRQRNNDLNFTFYI